MLDDAIELVAQNGVYDPCADRFDQVMRSGDAAAMGSFGMADRMAVPS
jgi:hypothetical protein